MVQPIQTTGAALDLIGRSNRSGRGNYSTGKNYVWNDIGFRAYMYGQARKMVKETATEAAQYAKSEMKDLGGRHASPGDFPAIQSGNLQDAIDSELYFETRRWIVARFGVYGDVARRSQEDYNSQYNDPTPVGQYAYTLATGAGREGKHWPWVQKTIDHVAEEGWVDVEMVGGVMGGAIKGYAPEVMGI